MGGGTAGGWSEEPAAAWRGVAAGGGSGLAVGDGDAGRVLELEMELELQALLVCLPRG